VITFQHLYEITGQKVIQKPWARHVVALIKKIPRKAMLFELAPQPGLEPGTYGLTEN
jgi:hypothetical protein